MSFILVDQLLKEGPSNPMDKLILVVVASFTNSKTGTCNPSLAGIAERASMTERGARQIVRRLEADRWLEIDVGGGRSGRSTYRINTERCSGFPDENTEHGSGYLNENPERGAPIPGTWCTETRNDMPPNLPENREENREGGYPLPPAALSDAEPGDEVALPSVRRSSTTRRKEEQALDGEVVGPEDHARAFEALWSNWPKRSGRSDAMAAWQAAIRGGAVVDAILRGAAAYVADRRMDKRGAAAIVQYTTPLSRWLRDASWEAWVAVPGATVQSQVAEEDEYLRIAEAAFAARAKMPF